MKYLLRALPVLLIAGAAAFAINSATAGPPPPVTQCANSTPGVITPETSDGNASQYINVARGGSQDVVTTTKGTWSPGCVQFTYDFYLYGFSTLRQSSQTSMSYTPTTADYGQAIVVRIWACDANDNCVSQDDVGQANVLGQSVLWDDFNGTAGSKPSSSLWYTRTDKSGFLQYDGTNLMSETGGSGGWLQMNAEFTDNDSDGDTSATDTDSGTAGTASEPDSDGNSSATGDWSSSEIQSANSMCSSGCGITVGSRYVEMRTYVPCTNNDTGWTLNNDAGWEFTGYEGPGYGSGGGNTAEIDQLEERSKTSWNGIGNGNYTYALGMQNFDKTGSWDADMDGDSVASDTDPTSVVPDGDDGAGTDADDTVAEGAHGDAWAFAAKYFLQGPTVCNAWETTGAKIEPHSVTFYWNGAKAYTTYTDASYCPSSIDADSDGDSYGNETDGGGANGNDSGTDSGATHSGAVNNEFKASGTDCPNLNMGTSYDLTTAPLKQIIGIFAYQDPPQGAANTSIGVDYVHINALS